MAQVPATSYESTSLGDVAEFTIPFPFLSRAEVFVTVDGASVPFTWINDGLVQLTTVPELGAVVRRYRSTAAYVPLHQFSTGVPFLPRYVDRDFKQTLYAVQESVNDTAGTAAQALATAEESLLLVQDAFDILGARTQYIVKGPYGPGILFETTSEVFSYDAGSGVEFYSPGPSITLPYTTTGVGAGEIANFRSVGDAILRSDLASPSHGKGASLVSWQRAPLVDDISTAHQMLSAQAVNIWEFASYVTSKPIPADPDTWDWTPAFQAAADSLVSATPPPTSKFGDLCLVVPQGRYKISSVSFGQRVTLMFTGGVLTPLDVTTSRTHLIKFNNFSRVYNLTIDANYATNYDTMVWCRGRYMDFFAPEVWTAKCAFTFGDPLWEGDPVAGILGDSEITIHGGATNWCITSARLFGQNTIVQWTGGHQAYSFKWTLPEGDPRKAAWEAQVEHTFINVGAVAYLTGCFTGNFSGQAANFLSKIQIADSPAYKNVYGRFHVNGTHLETGKILTCAPNGAVPIQDSKTQLLQMAGCSGYMSLGPGYIIDAQNAQQAIHIDACSFYGQPNDNICYAAAADVYISQDSFTVNSADFFQCLEIRYPTGFGGFTALDAYGTVQAFTPAAQTLKMPTVRPSDVHPSFASIWYNSATGIFTAQTTLRDVDIAVGLVYNAGLASDTTEFYLYIGGALTAIASVNGAAPSTVFKIPKLLRSATVEVRVMSANSRTPFGGPANYMRVSCSKTSGVK